MPVDIHALDEPQLRFAAELTAEKLAEESDADLQSLQNELRDAFQAASEPLGHLNAQPEQVGRSLRTSLAYLHAAGRQPQIVEDALERAEQNVYATSGLGEVGTIMVLVIMLGMVEIEIGPHGIFIRTKHDIPPRLHELLMTIIEKAYEQQGTIWSLLNNMIPIRKVDGNSPTSSGGTHGASGDGPGMGVSPASRAAAETANKTTESRTYWWFTGRRLMLTAAAMKNDLMAVRELRVPTPPTQQTGKSFLAGLFSKAEQAQAEDNTKAEDLLEHARAKLFPIQRASVAPDSKGDDRFDWHRNTLSMEEMLEPPQLAISPHDIRDWDSACSIDDVLNDIRTTLQQKRERKGFKNLAFSIGYELLGGDISNGRLAMTLSSSPIFDKKKVKSWGKDLGKRLSAELFIHRSEQPLATIGPHYVGKGASIQGRPKASFSMGVKVRDVRTHGDQSNEPDCALIPGHAMHNLDENRHEIAVMCPEGHHADASHFGYVRRCAWSEHPQNPNPEVDAALVTIGDGVDMRNYLGENQEAMGSTNTTSGHPFRDEEIGKDDPLYIYSAITPKRKLYVKEIDITYDNILLEGSDSDSNNWHVMCLHDAIRASADGETAAKPGDSGGVAVDKDKRPVATIAASTRIQEEKQKVNNAVLVPLSATLAALGAEL